MLAIGALILIRVIDLEFGWVIGMETMNGSGDRLRAAMDALRWSPRVLADVLGLGSDRTVRRWLNGQNAVPAEVVAWIERLSGDLFPLPRWVHERDANE